MKQEKKENMVAKQRAAVILKRNKKINNANIVILAVGLILTFTTYEVIGRQIVWIGIITFVYTLVSNYFARVGARQNK
ncbi:MAG: hypothetical protein P1P69_06980 [Methanosarcinaceae archaeon]|nr:hypothetical protein [Methanosarcinaceae archaeon]MDF1534230.1 hypothetical protein [Methanosarcinaceae archaeon]